MLRDQLARLGTEGSARVPKFVLPSILDVLARGEAGPLKALTFVVATWIRYLAVDQDEKGVALPKDDPLLEELSRRARAGGDDPAQLLVRALRGSAAGQPGFVETLEAQLQSLCTGSGRGPRSGAASGGR